MDEIVDMLYDLQEAEWRQYENAPRDLIDCGLIHCPGERLSKEQISEHLKGRAYNLTHFRIPSAYWKDFLRRG